MKKTIALNAEYDWSPLGLYSLRSGVSARISLKVTCQSQFPFSFFSFPNLKNWLLAYKRIRWAGNFSPPSNRIVMSLKTSSLNNILKEAGPNDSSCCGGWVWGRSSLSSVFGSSQWGRSLKIRHLKRANLIAFLAAISVRGGDFHSPLYIHTSICLNIS